MLASAALSVFALVSSVLAQENKAPRLDPIVLVHRVWPLQHTEAPAWSNRGSLQLSSSPQIDPSFLPPLQAPVASRYQLALVKDGVPEESWPMVSLPICRFIGTQLNDSISLIVDAAGHVLHLGVQTTAAADVCQLSQPRDALLTLQTKYTLVILHRQDRPDPPRLHAPVMVQYKQDGTVQPPEKEKSFFQKYWMYIVPLIVFTLMAPGDPKAQQERASNEGSVARQAAR